MAYFLIELVSYFHISVLLFGYLYVQIVQLCFSVIANVTRYSYNQLSHTFDGILFYINEKLEYEYFKRPGIIHCAKRVRSLM